MIRRMMIMMIREWIHENLTSPPPLSWWLWCRWATSISIYVHHWAHLMREEGRVFFLVVGNHWPRGGERIKSDGEGGEDQENRIELGMICFPPLPRPSELRKCVMYLFRWDALSWEEKKTAENFLNPPDASGRRRRRGEFKRNGNHSGRQSKRARNQ